MYCILQCVYCLSTDPTKVEAVYAQLGWNFWVFRPIHSKITMLSDPKNVNYVIISTKF